MSWKRELREAGEGVITALLLYLIIQATLMVTLGVERPLYVVISDSMRPVYEPGDILMVKRVDPDALQKGDIIVFSNPFGGIPIVHRIYEVRTQGGEPYFITKGDGNFGIDSYYQTEYPGIPPHKIIGTPVLKIPKVGYVQIWLRELIDVIRGQT